MLQGYAKARLAAASIEPSLSCDEWLDPGWRRSPSTIAKSHTQLRQKDIRDLGLDVFCEHFNVMRDFVCPSAGGHNWSLRAGNSRRT